jgi:hypothetical protein
MFAALNASQSCGALATFGRLMESSRAKPPELGRRVQQRNFNLLKGNACAVLLAA